MCLHLASSSANFNGCDTQLSRVKICSVCARTLPHSNFSRKQHHSSLRKCKSCIRQLDNSGTRGQVLLRNHRMSNGLVDEILHNVPQKKTHDRAIHHKMDLKGKKVFGKFAYVLVKQMWYACCIWYSLRFLF
jgi:hypothetical protein